MERELAQTLDVSRIPVRDALQAREQEGLVLTTSSHRRSVIQLTERDIRELYEVRSQLERLAVERATHNTSPAHQKRLDAMVRAMEQALQQHEAVAFPHTDIELHRLIWQQAGNHHLQRMLQTMSGQLLMFASRDSQIYEWDVVLDLHQDLVQHIHGGDSAAPVAASTPTCGTRSNEP